MTYPPQYRYTKDHEWVHVSGESAEIGITHHAQDQLGDVVFVELPDAGAKLRANGAFGTVESVKAVSDIYAPIGGDVIEVNEALIDNPELLNSDPHGAGWLVRVKVFDVAELEALMDAAQYAEYAAAEGG